VAEVFVEADPSPADRPCGRVVIGVDGSGRSRRLRELAGPYAVWLPRFASAADVDDLLQAVATERHPVVVDDAHLREGAPLVRVAGAAEDGVPVLLARRPTIRSPELAALDGAVASTGTVEVLGPLPDEAVAALLDDAAPEPLDGDVAARAVGASAGSPAIATALVRWSGDDTALPAALTALVQRRLALLPRAAASLVPVLAETVPLDPALLQRLTGVGPLELAEALDELVEAGLLVPDRDALVPAVAAAVRAGTAPAARRARGAAIAAAVHGAGADPHSEGWAVARGLDAARSGRAGRAADALERGGAWGRSLAAPLRFGTGVPVTQESTTGTSVAELLVDVAAAAARPHDALPLAVEAAEAVDRTPEPSLPDTPHALGAVLAVLAGDAPTAHRLLSRTLDTPSGAVRTRHVLLRAWVGLRTGRYDEAVAAVGEGVGDGAGAREKLLSACVAAGLARRSGDVAALRTAWSAAEPLLVRRTADLWQLEQLEELAVAGARLRQEHRTEPVLALLEEALDGLGRPAAWEAAMAWLRLQCAVVREDVDAAEEAARRLDRAVPATPPPGRAPNGLHRARAQVVAARCWTRALDGDVDAEAVDRASALLLAVDLPWEASRLAGQAAIRSADPAVARRLLERARELAAGPSATGGSVPAVVLSEREREVAELVRAGRTHREIGAQLYLSPKTVEHHVARMRSKLGAATRAEFLAALSRVLDGAAEATPSA
jgi:DNA-binding CsgD family transcriptional regulator